MVSALHGSIYACQLLIYHSYLHDRFPRQTKLIALLRKTDENTATNLTSAKHTEISEHLSQMRWGDLRGQFWMQLCSGRRGRQTSEHAPHALTTTSKYSLSAHHVIAVRHDELSVATHTHTHTHTSMTEVLTRPSVSQP